jgi:hypothetical protein
VETSTSRARRLDYLPLDKIPRAARNAKQHDLPKLRGSVDEFGCVLAGILDDRTGTLVAGHGRLEVLAQMRDQGEQPPEGVHIGDDGQWMVPILRGWSSRSDVQADAYVVADNRLNEIGGWDDRVLAEVLDEIADHNPDLLEITGYTGQDLDDIIALLGIEPTHKDASGGREFGDPDDAAFAPEIRIRVTSELFDRWHAALERYSGRDDAAKVVKLLDDLDGKADGWDGS